LEWVRAAIESGRRPLFVCGEGAMQLKTFVLLAATACSTVSMTGAAPPGQVEFRTHDIEAPGRPAASSCM
jgi:hypothetical protein